MKYQHQIHETHLPNSVILANIWVAYTSSSKEWRLSTFEPTLCLMTSPDQSSQLFQYLKDLNTLSLPKKQSAAQGILEKF